MTILGFTYPVPADVTFSASVPPAPTTASIAAPVPAPPPGPTFTVIVFVVTEVIVNLDQMQDQLILDMMFGKELICQVKIKPSSEF